MAQQLVVDQIQCNEETNEGGSDDIYLVIFRGNTTGNFDNNVGVHGPGGFWDDFDTGEVRNLDKAIAQYFPDSVYVTMLIEEDNDRDISGAEVIGAWKAQAALTWNATMLSFQQAGMFPLSTQRKAYAARKVGDALKGLASIYTNFPFGNDERIDQPKQIVISPGQTPVIAFNGDGGRYKVRFKITG